MLLIYYLQHNTEEGGNMELPIVRSLRKDEYDEHPVYNHRYLGLDNTNAAYVPAYPGQQPLTFEQYRHLLETAYTPRRH